MKRIIAFYFIIVQNFAELTLLIMITCKTIITTNIYHLRHYYELLYEPKNNSNNNNKLIIGRGRERVIPQSHDNNNRNLNDNKRPFL